MEHIGIFLREINFQKRRGLLLFQKGEISKHLFFNDGDLVYAKTNQKEELIGNILFRLGKLSREAYTKLDLFIEPMKAIGSVLVKNNFITEDDLVEALIYQMREIVLNLFSDFDGELRFQDQESIAEQEFDTHIKIPVLIEDGVRRMRYNEKIEKFLRKKILHKKSDSFFFRLSEAEKDILNNIHDNTVSDELLSTMMLTSEIFWKSLYLLYVLNLIDLEAMKEQGPTLEPKKESKSETKMEPEKPKTKDTQVSVDDVVDLSDRLKEMNYYQILNIDRKASLDEIKKAYFQMARKYHPDLFERDLPAEVKKKITMVFDSLTKGYRTLIDEEVRKEYDEKVDEGPINDRVDKIKKAEVRFRQSKTLFDQARYDEAIVYIEEAVRMDETKAKYFMFLGMVEAKIPNLRRKAERSFLKAVELEPWNAEIYTGLGLLYKQVGMPARAAKQFKKALTIDPDYRVARKELGLMGEDNKKKGLKDLLSLDFFGKKKK